LTQLAGVFAHPTRQDYKRVLVTLATSVSSASPAAMSSLLSSINSPLAPADPQPSSGLCASPLLGPLCTDTKFGAMKIADGCATVALQCTPSTLAAKKCIASGGAAGSYILVRNPTTRAATVFFDGEVQGLADVGLNDTSSMDSSARKLLATAQPKAAVFQACCVSPKQREPPKGNAPTCKRINVGKTMTKLKRLSKCKCLNLREFVKAEMCVVGHVEAHVLPRVCLRETCLAALTRLLQACSSAIAVLSKGQPVPWTKLFCFGTPLAPIELA
jgi:hypothetical protein